MLIIRAQYYELSICTILQMKYILIVSFFLASHQIAWSTTNPECLISNEYIDVLAKDTDKIFETSKYDFNNDIVIFNTFKKVSYIQIYDENDFLEFQLPVLSKQVKLDKNLFGKGQYKLAFKLEGNNEIFFTTVFIKA